MHIYNIRFDSVCLVDDFPVTMYVGEGIHHIKTLSVSVWEHGCHAHNIWFVFIIG